MKKILVVILAISLLLIFGFSKLNNNINVSKKDNNIKNLFFFNTNVLQSNYKGEFSFDTLNEDIEKVVRLYIYKVTNLKNGELYELKINSIKDVPDNRLNLGYFYVQKDKIYRIYSTKQELEKLKISNKIPNNSAIVCSDKEIKDLNKGKRGWHQYIDINGSKREYHSYDDSGDTGFYESFTWERNKGLIYYQSGYGAEANSIELQLDNN